ncbi:hypothetical protein LSM04_008286 [Trypanosoma melophagium]|uniref:uncharacterized protein n=1 Tax=Trypanosoma melophagium TaxID=715481 RepID=UPI00351A1B3B|nr:hypothetical protein LSM04_008286 [Trypanosoma melophagium]
MFRRSYRRFGHQLLKEPMGHEENTFARGQRTMENALNHVYGTMAFCAAGCVCALYSLVSAAGRLYKSVNEKGEMGKSTCPTKWWNY